MSFMDQLYDLSSGAVVEIQLKETKLRGEFNIVSHGSMRNPDLDEVRLVGPIELPSGKMRNGTVSFPVRDIINCKYL